MNEATVEHVPKHVSALTLMLLDGWEPTVRPFARPVRFVFGGREMSANAREVQIRGDALDVVVEDLDELSFDHDERDLLRNEPFEIDLSDGGRVVAESAFLDFGFVRGHYWSTGDPSRAPELWIAPVKGLGSTGGVGNLSIKRTKVDPDGTVTVATSHMHHRFAGAYTYYLIRRDLGGSDDDWFLIVDTGSSALPSRDQIYPDMLGLQFVLGRGFHFDVLHGIDQAGGEVALVGGRHGRAHGQHEQSQPPVPIQMTSKHWPSVFFSAISQTYRSRPELRLYIALSYYLDALASFNVENRYLVLQVALEGFAFWLLGGDNAQDQLLVDKPKWKTWLQARRAEIEELAVQGQGNSLFNKIVSVPKRRATSRVVEAAFSHVGLTVTDEMAEELDEDGRGLIVHAAIMFRDSQRDVDAYRRRIAIVRTMLVGLVARAAGYRGAITGWERAPGRPCGEPDLTWWPIDDAARVQALRRYLLA